MAIITSNGAGGGLFSAPTAWAGGVVPVAGDKVTIATGDTITVDGVYTIGDDTTTAVTVSGTLLCSQTINTGA